MDLADVPATPTSHTSTSADARGSDERAVAPGTNWPTLDDLLEKTQGENFPVASRLLPARYRSHLLAVYGFARLVDDIGDEAPPAQRIESLNLVENELNRLYSTLTDKPPDGGSQLHYLMDMVTGCRIERDLFVRLIEANRQDQRVTRYETFADLLGYCRLSADPIGRIVLAVFDVRSPAAEDLSDRICTALQLVEHWQDVAEDHQKGRVYLPQEDLSAFQVTEDHLDAAVASPGLRRLMSFETERAAELLASGAPLVGLLRGSARLAVAGYVAGGYAAIDALRRVDGDVLTTVPRARRRDVLRHFVWLLIRALSRRYDGDREGH